MSKIIDAEAFEAFVQKAFKMSAEEVASLYNDAGELTDFSTIERKDAERIMKLSTDKTNQYNRGLKEASLKLEKAIREKYDIDSDLTGVELVDFVIGQQLEGADTKDTGDVMKHPDVIKLINEHGKALKAKDKEWSSKLTEKESEVSRAMLFGKVKNVALSEFEALKPILSEDARKASAQKEIFVRELEKSNYQDDGGNIIVLGGNNEIMKDEHGHPVSFSDHVRKVAETYFDFRAADDRSSPGNRDSSGGQRVKVPTNNDEYVAAMRNAKTPEEKKQIMKSYVYKK